MLSTSSGPCTRSVRAYGELGVDKACMGEVRLSHFNWSIFTRRQLKEGIQTREFFSMSHSHQQQQHDANAAVDDFEFASIFAYDLSWLDAFAIPSSIQLALVGDEAMSPCALSTPTFMCKSCLSHSHAFYAILVPLARRGR